MKFLSLFNPAHRRIKILISGIGLTSIFLLATSISSLGFKTGETLAAPKNHFSFPVISLPNSQWWLSFCVSIILALVPIGLVMLMFSKEARKLFKKNLKGVLIWLIFFIIIQYLLNRGKDESITLGPTKDPITRPDIIEPPSSIGIETDLQDVFIPPDFVNWQAYIIGFLLIIIIGILIYYFWEKNRSKNDQIKQILLSTIKEVQEGRQWEDAVIQCYAQMTRVVSKKRKLVREVSMTPGEFARHLEKEGLPQGPIKNLTILFERARYGVKATHTDEVNNAVEYLNEIVQALEPH